MNLKNFIDRNKLLYAIFITGSPEVIVFIIVFSLVGLLFIIMPSTNEEREKCKKTCGDKGFIHIPRVLSGLDSLGSSSASKDCYCSEKPR